MTRDELIKYLRDYSVGLLDYAITELRGNKHERARWRIGIEIRDVNARINKLLTKK